MSTHRQRRIDRAGAERLLDSIARQSAQSTDPLADLLRAVVPAPEPDRQLPGEAAAVDAFHRAVTVPGQTAATGHALGYPAIPTQATTPAMGALMSATSTPVAVPKSRRAQHRSMRPVSFAVKVVAATAVLATAGVAVANAAGVLPGHRDGTRPRSSASATTPTSGRTDQGSPTTQVPPTAVASDSATPGSAAVPGQSPSSSNRPNSSATPGSNGNSVAALCHKFLRDDDATRAKDLQNPSFQRVIDAAGSSGNVAGYCATHYPLPPAQTKPTPAHPSQSAKTGEASGEAATSTSAADNRATNNSATRTSAANKGATKNSATGKSGKS